MCLGFAWWHSRLLNHQQSLMEKVIETPGNYRLSRWSVQAALAVLWTTFYLEQKGSTRWCVFLASRHKRSVENRIVYSEIVFFPLGKEERIDGKGFSSRETCGNTAKRSAGKSPVTNGWGKWSVTSILVTGTPVSITTVTLQRSVWFSHVMTPSRWIFEFELEPTTVEPELSGHLREMALNTDFDRFSQ